MIHVAVGVIRSPDRRRILISQRARDSHQGGLWEFPGGKVEPGESLPAALRRELREELDITVQSSHPLRRVSHDYGDRRVVLDVHYVDDWSGEPRGMEGQPLRWVTVEDLDPADFPLANRAIIRALRLSGLLAITPDCAGPSQALSLIEQLIGHHAGLIRLRFPSMETRTRDRLLSMLDDWPAPLRRRLLLPADSATEQQARFGGCHLAESELRMRDARSLDENLLLGASCHDRETLERATALGADYATLSPVRATASHPGTPGMGWRRFAALVEGLDIPVYALGGLGPDDADEARRHGARGVAGIRAMQHPDDGD